MADKLFQIQSYLNLALKGRSKYYIHSPFVFQLIQEVIDKQLETPSTQAIKSYRDSLKKRLLPMSSIVPGLEYISPPKDASLAYLNKQASIPHAYGRCLHHLVQFMQAKKVLEIGSCIGISSAYMASANKVELLQCLEGNPLRIQAAEEMHQELGINNIYTTEGLFQDTLPSLCSKGKSWDFVYMDGHHEYAPTMDYFHMLLPTLHEASCVVMDDIYWSKGMNKAWNEIRTHPNVMLSVDLFRFGWLFFNSNRKEQEHFKLFMNLR